MTPTPEQQVALERLRRAGPACYLWKREGDYVGMPQGVIADLLQLYRLALAQNPPDQPLTPDSLRTLGVELDRWYEAKTEDGMMARARVILFRGSFLFTFQQTRGASETFDDDDEYDTIQVTLTTLSQARSLLAGLGVEMEGKDG